MRHLEKWPFTSDALFSLMVILMEVFSVGIKGKDVHQMEAETLSVAEALEHLKVGGLDRVVAVKVNGTLQDLSTELGTNTEFGTHLPPF